MNRNPYAAPDKTEWWANLRHGGLLLDLPRLSQLIKDEEEPITYYDQERLRRRIQTFEQDPAARTQFITFFLEAICGITNPAGTWYRGNDVSAKWSQKMLTGESVKPRQIWIGQHDSVFPVFVDEEKRLGIGRGRRVLSHALQWLRKSDQRLALITNGNQWRIVFAGLDYDAFCQWELETWFQEGYPSPELNGLRSLLNPQIWVAAEEGQSSPFLDAINESRKGQADLSQILGERVRCAVEHLIHRHAPALTESSDSFSPRDLYHAGVRLVMRLVVILFAESRYGLLPIDNPVYHNSYGLTGLRQQLERMSRYRRRNSYSAYARVLSLFNLVHSGSSHEALVVHNYGGQLFQTGDPESDDPMSRALYVLENACYPEELVSDEDVYEVLTLLTQTKVRIRQGRSTQLQTMPVDFSSLDSEYIGILYEGLLDFELRCAGADQPIVFLAVGNQPALPLTTLENMDDKAIKQLLEKMKDTSSGDDEKETDDEESVEDDDGPVDESDDDEELGEDDEPVEEEENEEVDERMTLRGRAEDWARRAVKVGKLIRKPASSASPEKKLKYEEDVNRKARQITPRVILPGEWYLVRWGGTRKGSGTFYTRPQLAVPTVHRTLRPLAYDPPITTEPKAPVASGSGDNDETQTPPLPPGEGQGGQGEGSRPEANLDAPIEEWTPKKPEAILNLKVCDPACGSGSFPLAALRFLTEALFTSLQFHNRIREHAGRAVLDLILDEESGETLADEKLPCRPDDDDFEPRTKAVLRRYIVERCIYGVDLDPLAVELCRLSLWIETLDPRLPFTFLDHKIKCGNSLIGTWFDQFMHYPAMAWMREGGDKNHTNGVHFEKESWTKAIKAKVKDIKKELIDYIDGARLIYKVDLSTIETVHDAAEQVLQDIHQLGIHEVEQRAELYRSLRDGAEFRDMKFAFDLWCSIWFWPPEQIDECPLPIDFYENELSDAAKQIVTQLSADRRFFHWELEFPDVFNKPTFGFDAVLGNPPWDTAKPYSIEFFSAIDPLYRTYGKQEALKWQTSFFEDEDLERNWLNYNAFFRSLTNWIKYVGHPFGGRISVDSKDKGSHDLNIGDRGRSSFTSGEVRHVKWRQKREELTGYADAEHAFRHQGSGDNNLYKLFLEQAHAILRQHGRLGLIVPSGLYSDYGTRALREIFLSQCRWDWLYSFINWDRIFVSVYYRFKFCIAIISKGESTFSVRTAFGRYQISDWEDTTDSMIRYDLSKILAFSPVFKVFLESRESNDLDVLETIYENSTLLSKNSDTGTEVKYTREFDLTNDSKLFPTKPLWESKGYRPDEYGRWLKGNWQFREPDSPAPTDCNRADIDAGVILSRDQTCFISESEIAEDSFKDKKGKLITGRAIALPLYEGRMIGQFDFSDKGWVSGKGRTAVWREIDWSKKEIDPQYLMLESIYENDLINGYLQEIKKNNGTAEFNAEENRMTNPVYAAWVKRSLSRRMGFMDIASATNERTMISCAAPQFPFGHSAPILLGGKDYLFVLGVLNSLAYDAIARARCSGLHLTWFVLSETAIPNVSQSIRDSIANLVRRLACASQSFAQMWQSTSVPWRSLWAVTPHERTRLQLQLDAVIAGCFGLQKEQFNWLMRNCDYPAGSVTEAAYGGFDPKGFWRVDKRKSPELRYPILAQVAFDNFSRIQTTESQLEQAVESFQTQNDGEGWQLPERLRLSDYGLGQDDRAKEYQPVRECFGPRFYDWQLEQSAEESWRECHLHARNLLGPTGYQALLDELAGKTPPTQVNSTPPKSKSKGKSKTKNADQKELF